MVQASSSFELFPENVYTPELDCEKHMELVGQLYGMCKDLETVKTELRR
jgi:hypothetical protein